MTRDDGAMTKKERTIKLKEQWRRVRIKASSDPKAFQFWRKSFHDEARAFGISVRIFRETTLGEQNAKIK